MNYRQGDVYLISCDLPTNLKTTENDVLAIGEATGHCHRIFDGEVLVGEDGQLFVTASKETTLRHVDPSEAEADHKPITLDPGSYRVVIQREYEPEGYRAVVD